MATFDSSTTPIVNAALAFRDAAGNPARVDGVPTWENSDSGVAAMTVGEDGLSATFEFVGVGKTSVSVHADADLGEGVRELVLLGELEFAAGEAVVGEIIFAAPPAV